MNPLLQEGGGLLDAWPIGSIYISINSTSPANLFGGSWKEIQGYFLLGRSSAHSAGETGGEETHTLTIQEMPKHNHSIPYTTRTGGHSETLLSSDLEYSSYTGYTGGSQPHNNMPPYLSVYMWKRTA